MASLSETEDDTTHFVDVDKLLALVQGNPVIFNASLKEHYNVDVIAKIWSDIGNELSVPGAICKAKWNNLRNSYARHMRDLKKMPSGSAKKKKKWYLADAMEFLQPWTGSRKMSSSLTTPQSFFELQDSTGTPVPTHSYEQADTQTPTAFLIDSDVSLGSGEEFVPKKRIKKTPAKMVAALMVDFLKVATEHRKSEENQAEHPMLNYFKSLLPDTDILTDGRKRRFKLAVMDTLNNLIEEQENES